MTGRGRPRKGTRTEVRLSDEALAQVDAWASAHDIRDRAEALRQLVELGLRARRGTSRAIGRPLTRKIARQKA